MISLDPITAPRSDAERKRLDSELIYWRAVARAYPDWITERVRLRIAELERALAPKKEAA